MPPATAPTILSPVSLAACMMLISTVCFAQDNCSNGPTTTIQTMTAKASDLKNGLTTVHWYNTSDVYTFTDPSGAWQDASQMFYNCSCTDKKAQLALGMYQVFTMTSSTAIGPDGQARLVAGSPITYRQSCFACLTGGNQYSGQGPVQPSCVTPGPPTTGGLPSVGC